MSRGPVVEAMVQVGDMEIPYVCAGRGPTILVLEHPTADVDQRVWEGWTARYRLIRTRLPIDEASAPRIVALVEGSADLLLGWSYVDLGGGLLGTPSFFSLERDGPLTHHAVPPLQRAS